MGEFIQLVRENWHLDTVFPIHEHDISLHFLIFNCLLRFCSFQDMSVIHLLSDLSVSIYFLMLFIVFLNSSSDYLLLVYRNTFDFCILNVTLLILLVPVIFCRFRFFYVENHVVNGDFSICMPSLSCLIVYVRSYSYSVE